MPEEIDKVKLSHSLIGLFTVLRILKRGYFLYRRLIT